MINSNRYHTAKVRNVCIRKKITETINVTEYQEDMDANYYGAVIIIILFTKSLSYIS